MISFSFEEVYFFALPLKAVYGFFPISIVYEYPEAEYKQQLAPCA